MEAEEVIDNHGQTADLIAENELLRAQVSELEGLVSRLRTHLQKHQLATLQSHASQQIGHSVQEDTPKADLFQFSLTLRLEQNRLVCAVGNPEGEVVSDDGLVGTRLSQHVGAGGEYQQRGGDFHQ